MSIIINSLEILDANGTSLTNSIANFKKGSQSNYQQYLIDPVKNLVKYDVPMTDDDIDQQLSEFNFKEHYMPRTVKMATLVALRATAGLKLPKNTVVIGSTLEGSSEVKGEIWNSFTNKKSKASPRACATGTASTVCTTVSRTLGISGPSFMITQACSGFITALDLATKFLNSDTADVVLVVSVDSTQPLNGYMFRSMGVYTSEIVRPLDANRSGMALGEGAACYVVTKEKHAQRQVSRIKKISLYNDFYNLIAPHPEGIAGTHLLTDLGAYETQVGSINAHATATKVGDDIELSSIEKLPYVTDIFGLKGSVGHTLSSSAGIEMAYSIAGLNEGWIPYTSNLATPLPTKHTIVRDNILEKQTDNFIKLSFGFGGVSAGILVEKINK